MKKLLVAVFLLNFFLLQGQNKIEWDGKYSLKLSDFQSPSSQIGDVNIFSIQTGSTFDFEYVMNAVEFMMTKNFNDKVDCYFLRNNAVLIAPDSVMAYDLLAFAQYTFDLSELYARKLRKSLYENKNAFSKYNFYKEYFDKMQNDYVREYSDAGKMTNLGRDRKKLNELHRKVLKEIDDLSQFCKTCKPKKNRKKQHF